MGCLMADFLSVLADKLHHPHQSEKLRGGREVSPKVMLSSHCSVLHRYMLLI